MVTTGSPAREADVCIVGAGPVGLTLATVLLSRGASVVVLDSGGPDAALDDAAPDDALDGTLDAPDWAPLWTSRARGVGGTSRIWNTVVDGERVAKYALLDPLDFEARPGLPHTGWPFGAEALRPFVARASNTCGLAGDVWHRGPDDVWHRGPETDLRRGAPKGATAGALVRRPYAFGPRRRFTIDLVETLEGSPRARLMREATATGFVLADGGRRVEGVRWVGSPGGIVYAATTILAGGALENARILLATARADSPPWSEAFWLGRGLMEHPVDRSLELHTRSALLCPDPGRFGPHLNPRAEASGWRWTMDRVGLDLARLRESRLPNASLRFTTQEASPAVLEAPVARSWARRLVPGSRARRMVGDVVRAAAREVRRLRGLRYRLRVDLEQWPDPDNRLVLTDDLDAHGRRRLGLRWRWSDDDESRRRRLIELFVDGLEGSGLGRLELAGGHSLDPNAHHHAGTTRMAESADDGVVDADLRVHGTDNLFVCGSSVFPTTGAVNPTLTAVALAHRLADHLHPPAD